MPYDMRLAAFLAPHRWAAPDATEPEQTVGGVQTRRRRIGRVAIAAAVVLSAAIFDPRSIWAADQPVPNAAVQTQSAAPVVALSDQARQVGQLAARNGDQDFLLVDKNRGRIVLFASGNPIFSASALTGHSRTDRLPPGSLAKSFSRLTKLADKVTPAGRFTVNRDYDKAYGELLEINEIQGKDWAIAIHRVYLATSAERRAERLESPDHSDKQITHGCINVSDKTMLFLLRELPKTKPAAVLYVLPHDEGKTEDFFPRRDR